MESLLVTCRGEKHDDFEFSFLIKRRMASPGSVIERGRGTMAQNGRSPSRDRSTLRKLVHHDQRDVLQPLCLDLPPVIDAIAAGIEKDEDGKPLSGATHHFWAYSSSTEPPRPQDFELSLVIDQNWKHAMNFVGLAPHFTIDHQDPAVVTFNAFRETVLALAEEFDAAFAKAYSRDLMFSWPQGRECPDLPPTWISYLGPRYAHLVTPPDTAVTEYRPDGGLLMAATKDVFDMDNPLHMAVAHDIARAVTPFNALPRPLSA